MFEYAASAVVVLAVVVAFWVYQRQQRAQAPASPILEDDAEMIAARQEACAELSRFRELLGEPHDRALVKIPVTSSRGVVEWMWGDVRELRETIVSVQFESRPATHRGNFQPYQTFPISAVGDWLVVAGDRRFGGYTQRVALNRLKAEDRMDPAMAAEAAKYE